jgi:hypothetical protein
MKFRVRRLLSGALLIALMFAWTAILLITLDQHNRELGIRAAERDVVEFVVREERKIARGLRKEARPITHRDDDDDDDDDETRREEAAAAVETRRPIAEARRDHDEAKARWRDDVRAKLRALVDKEQRGDLRGNDARHRAYEAPDRAAVEAATAREARGDRATILTGANGAYFGGLENLIGSLHFWEPGRRVVVYNLGLRKDELDKVRTWKDVDLRWPDGIPSDLPGHANELKHYAWKPLAIQDALRDHRAVLWLDAGSDVRGPLDVVDAYLEKDGVFFVCGQDTDMTRWTHQGMLDYFHADRNSLRGNYSISGNTQGWVRGSRATMAIFPRLVACALAPACVAPAKSSLSNHRYDQSALSVAAYTSTITIEPHTELLAAGRDQLRASPREPSAMRVYTARTHSRDYVGDVQVAGEIRQVPRVLVSPRPPPALAAPR